MDNGNKNSKFDIDNDPDFNENFYKNIEKVMGDTSTQETKLNNELNSDSISESNTELNNELKPELKKGIQQRKEDIVQESETKLEIKPEEIQEEKIEQGSLQEAEPDNKMNEIYDAHLSNETEDNKPADYNASVGIEQQSDDENEGIDDQLTDINSSLAKQISDEIDQDSVRLAKLKKKKRRFKIQSCIVITLICIVGFGLFLGFTKPGNKILMRFGVNIGGIVWDNMTNKFDDSTDVVADVDHIDDADKESDAPEVDPNTIKWPKHPGAGMHVDGVYNVLLLGEENIYGDKRGRTDSIVIATLNTNDKTVKLTSLMRDLYVQIPGYNDNKLNTAYEKGGLDLLYETIALNFDIRLDGCVMVNFEDFQKIVDDLGGLEITLKQNEADYLNAKNYISNKKYRNVKAGKQLLNGNQVMGYVRVRKTSTITGQNNDYGRTDRHRIVLNAIYEKCRSKGKAELLSLMLKYVHLITTDIDNKCFELMLNSYVDMGMNTKDIQQLRIPADNTFKDNIKVRRMSVLIPDLDANIKILHEFIFSDQAKATQTSTGLTAGTKASSSN